MADFKKLFNEQCINEAKTELIESTNGQKRLYISGVFMGAEKKNRNGRTYPRPIIEREVKNYQTLIESREALGELSHPDSGEINPDRAAILVEDLHMDGDFAMGKAKVLSTPCGKILEALLTDGVRMGVSSRGTGNLLEGNIVADDYHMICCDVVYLPSCPDAYQDAMYESVQRTTEWVLNESLGLYVEREAENNADQMVNGIQVTSPQKAEQIVRATEEFNKKIDRKGSREIKKAFAEWFKTL